MKKKSYKLTDKVYITDSAIVEFGGSNGRDVGFSAERGYGLNGSHIPWGEKDNVLREMHQLCCENPTKWRLMTTKRDFVIGKGLRVGVEGIDKKDAMKLPTVKAITAFLKRLDLQTTLKDAALQLEFSGRYYIKISLDFSRRISGVELVDVFHCRPRKMEDGESKISAYILNANFGSSRYKKKDDVVLPAFDFREPTKYAAAILDVRERIPGQVYHSFGFWWGTKDWTKVANKVPNFHDNGLENGYNIKYHVSIPDNYFEGDDMTKQQEDEMKQEVCAAIDETLRGKTDSVLFTFHTIDVNGKEITGVKVTPIPNHMSDDAYTAIFNTANIAQASAHGILPILAGIDTGSKLGGSGKELEVAANYLQAFLTYPTRELLLRTVLVLKEIEGWSDELTFEFENVELYNFDVTPAGASINQNTNGNDGTTD